MSSLEQDTQTSQGVPQPPCLLRYSHTDKEKVLQSTPKANGETATGSLCMWVKGIIF